MPVAESFIGNRNTLERYLPDTASIQSFEFDTCSGSNCFDFESGSKKNIVYENIALILVLNRV